MLTGQNSSISGNLSQLIDKAGAKITSAIQNASDKTGVDFSYLIKQAQIESSFKTDVKASTSSATGLYQFIDKTWLSMVNKYGDKYGLTDLANQINENGKVACNSVKKEILELRKNPELCSYMAAELAADNKSHIEKSTGKEAGATELYMAHFMGPSGASKFLNALDKNPNAQAADLFPDAAHANKNVFYDKAGNSKSLQQVYDQFDKKFASLETDSNITKKTPEVSQMAEVQKQKTDTEACTLDISTENVLASLTPRVSKPLYTNTSSLYTNMDYPEDTSELSDIRTIPNNFYSKISTLDILELLKSGYADYKTNS
jgi:Transglycosylase SLT domain